MRSLCNDKNTYCIEKNIYERRRELYGKRFILTNRAHLSDFMPKKCPCFFINCMLLLAVLFILVKKCLIYTKITFGY